MFSLHCNFMQRLLTSRRASATLARCESFAFLLCLVPLIILSFLLLSILPKQPSHALMAILSGSQERCSSTFIPRVDIDFVRAEE